MASRGAQMFPRLASEEVARLVRFGRPCCYRAGNALARVGEIGPGLTLIVSGEVEIVQHDATGERRHIVTHEAGSILGELAQLSAVRSSSTR